MTPRDFGSTPAPARGRGRGAEPPFALWANGVDGATGKYLLPSPELTEVLAAIGRDGRRPLDPPTSVTRRLVAGRDPERLDQAGWGVVFGRGVGSAVRKNLAPLLDLRRGQATASGEALYHEIESAPPEGELETKQSLLERFESGPGPVDPRRAPYYLLLVGDPGELSFPLQYQLDVQHAVGRLWLDSPDDYRRYAETVVAAERGELETERRVAIFAPDNDAATRVSAAHLAAPLARWLRRRPDWEVEESRGEAARKEFLKTLLDDPSERPAVVFTASHGMSFPSGHRLQETSQGALLCQDWPGPEPATPVAAEHYLAAPDLVRPGGCRGSVTFHFACWGAGTPARDDFDLETELAPDPFVSPLPRKLLGQGGALAVVGHVDRAWGYSFVWPGTGRQLTVFQDAFYQLLDGSPVGLALAGFGERAAELGLDLLENLESLDFGRKPSEVVGAWTAFRDARNTILLGDPAVRLAA